MPTSGKSGRKGGSTGGCLKTTGPAPGLQETGESVQRPGMTMAKKTFQHATASGQVLVIMRYKNEMDRRIRNCLIRMKSRTGQFGTEGRCVGISTDIRVLEGLQESDWCQRSDWCIALFVFPSLEKAQLWYRSEPELRQHDFLPPSDGVQLFALKMRYVFPPVRNLTFNWVEMHNIRSHSFLQQEYVDKAAEMLDDEQVNHGLIFLQDPGNPCQLFRFKESWIPHNEKAYCVMHLYEDEAQFYKISGTEKDQQLREKRHEACDVVSLLFTICSNVTDAPVKE